MSFDPEDAFMAITDNVLALSPANNNMSDEDVNIAINIVIEHFENIIKNLDIKKIPQEKLEIMLNNFNDTIKRIKTEKRFVAIPNFKAILELETC